TAIYSMGYGFVISIGNKKVYADIQNSMRHHEKKIAIIVFLAGCIGTFYDSLFILFPIFSILWLVMRYMKSVEKICLVRTRAWKDVVEFDVPVKNVKYRDKILQGTKDPNGFDLNVLRKCRKLAKEGRIRKKIVVKWGIPMIPVFPITILVSVFFGDITFWLMNILI
ncbi:MAG: hypothetical protein QF475_02880, partial [Candidatus Undinarchaeales archaeon]|nr:hypothetical protein [Candidatus Undinarchaeales archaeon]